MMQTKTGVVRREIGRRTGLLEVEVEVAGGIRKAVAYEDQSGPVRVGDRVLLNTTAASLELGSGGRDFIMVNLDQPEME
ncbi:DUF3866 family protein, partial [bacterium]|nr:DUF3866 family protein [bacterium]